MHAPRSLRALPRAGARYASGAAQLKAVLAKKIPEQVALVNKIKKEHGETSLGQATVGAAYGGMRGITGLTYEPSLLDPVEGIRFRGLTIPECQAKLPNNAPHGQEPYPEGMLWLLLTGEVPTKEQVAALTRELNERANHPIMAQVTKTLDSLPVDMHPMLQFSAGILTLGHASKFSAGYAEGKATKNNYWEYALEDTLDCVARLPTLAAQIYRRSFHGSSKVAPVDPNLDWAANFTRQLGFESAEFADCMRLYLSIHTDHEGGNVSAHTTILVGSALSDPYLSLSAGMNGLAGPLHGLANQEVLLFLRELQGKVKERGGAKTPAELEKKLTELIWELLNNKRVVPGYGHAVLRKTDPRYACQRDFCLRNFPNDELFQFVDTVYKITPGILTEHGKTKNPWPNVDAHSGVLLQYYGLTESRYYTVLFGVSRALGVLPALIWDRALGKPIERPKSITTAALAKKFNIA